MKTVDHPTKCPELGAEGRVREVGKAGAAEAVGRGLLDFASHSGRMNPYAGELGAIVYHGSPHKFDAFDLSKIGTGEGQQSYGYGLYLAENPKVAKFYSDVLSKSAKAGAYDPWWKDMVRQRMAAGDSFTDAIARVAGNDKDLFQKMSQLRIEDYAPPPPGNLYTVDLPDEAIAKMLDWDKPLSEQGPEVQTAIQNISKELGVPASEFGSGPLGPTVVKSAMEEQLRAQGIPGIRYLDGGSRKAGEGTRNFVVFDDKLPKILKRE